MKDFEFYYPAHVVFGKDSELRAGEYASSFGKKALLHYDGGDFLKDSGLLDKVRKSLEEKGMEVYELGGVRPNPRLSLMREGIRICKEEGIEVIVGLGGGSTMDSAKTIAVGAVSDMDVYEYALNPFTTQGKLPLVVIPTMSGTGSEISICAMVVNDEKDPEVKKALMGFDLIPNVTIIDPALQSTLPARQAAAGCMDIISQAMFSYFTDTRDVYLTDKLGEAIMETVVKFAPRIIEDPNDYAAREQIALAASLGAFYMSGYTRESREVGHEIENPLTTMHMLAHGQGLAIVTPSLMRYTYKKDLPRFARFAHAVMGVEADTFDLETMALEGIIRLESFIKDRLHLATHLSELGLADKTNIDALIEYIKVNGRGFPFNEGSVYELSEDDVRKIYENCR